MGAENSILENCNLGKKLPIIAEVDWIIQEAVQKQSPTSANLAVFTRKKKDRRRELDIIQLNANQLKSLRHPGIVQYVTSGQSADGFYLVTEYVTPLEMMVKDLSPIEICSGLYNIIEALVFLHEKVGISHNNICKSSIFVTNDGSWKLGGFEHACHFEHLTSKYLDNCRALRCENAITPEEKANNLCIEAKSKHVLDAYSFGILAGEFSKPLQELGDLFKTFELRIQDEYLSPDPKQRSQLSSLLNDRLFKYENHFLEIKLFLKNITLKSAIEKKEFFSQAVSMLQKFPEELIGKRLIQLLLSRFVVLNEDAVKMMIPSLLTPRSENEVTSEKSSGQPRQPCIFSKVSFKKYVIPELVNIFQVHEVHIRLLLLKYFPYYVELLERQTIEDVIFPQLLLGLRDVNDALVSASLHSLADLVPILGGDAVIGGPQKSYFREGKPKVVQDTMKEEKLSSVHEVIGKPLLKDLAISNRKTSLRKTDTATDDGVHRKLLDTEKETRKLKETNLITEGDHVELHVAEPSKDVINDEYTIEEKIGHPEDWSEWDDNSFGWEEKRQYIDDEIEAELKQMSSSEECTEKEDLSTKEDLKNSVNEIHSNSVEINVDSKSKEDWLESSPYNDSWKSDKHHMNNNNHSSSPSIKTNENQDSSKNEVIHSSISSNSSKHHSQKQLGEEFDIMNIKIITKKKEEIDYFADMQPVISPTPKGELPRFCLSPTDTETSSTLETEHYKNAGLSFAISEDAAEVSADGWDDELNWEEVDAKIN